MPLLDIATSQPYFGSHICTSRAQLLVPGSTLRKITFRKEKKVSFTWKVSIPRKVNYNVGHPNMRDALLIRAVTTLEQKCITHDEVRQEDDHRFLFDPDSNHNTVQSSIDSELDDKEKLRRMRISNANKGNVPWNKGRKHTPETLRRIRERTKIAMQDPKVKMKLVNLGHAQTEETRIKIGVGVRMGWKRRREKIMVQETCCFEWQNLVADASRRGYGGEEELQWDSYKILDKQLEQEWLDSIEQRKSTPRPKGNKRAPKSPEQRKKISEAISAKWNDPEYRGRVCSALEKYHGIPIGAPRRTPKRKPSGDSESVKSTVKRKVKDTDTVTLEKKSQARTKPKRTAPKYKDPLADSKLEMIKNIRVQRMAMDTKKTEAMERARLLIMEAEKAANALEEAALTSPLARASLLETRKLIAEATRSIEAVETGQIPSHEHDNYSSPKLNGRVNHYGEEATIRNDNITPPKMKEVNGVHVPLPSNGGIKDFDFGEVSVQDRSEHSSPSFQPNALEYQQMTALNSNGAIRRTELPYYTGKTGHSQNGTGQTSGTPSPTTKWVRGRLVDVSEDDVTVDQEK